MQVNFSKEPSKGAELSLTFISGAMKSPQRVKKHQREVSGKVSGLQSNWSIGREKKNPLIPSSKPFSFFLSSCTTSPFAIPIMTVKTGSAAASQNSSAPL